MLQNTGKEASLCKGTESYTRHRPERTLLYQLIQAHYPFFEAHCAEQGKPLPAYVCQEFNDYLKCGCLEHRFLRVQCDMHPCFWGRICLMLFRLPGNRSGIVILCSIAGAVVERNNACGDERTGKCRTW